MTLGAKVVFVNGKGTGTSDFSIGTPNHADESCDVRGAKLQIVPAPR